MLNYNLFLLTIFSLNVLFKIISQKKRKTNNLVKYTVVPLTALHMGLMMYNTSS